MHRIIMNAPAGLQVDHINGDTLDNRRSNLRLATAHLNMANRKLGIGNRSGYKGVSRHRSTGKWQARIQVNGRQIWLGLFTDLIDAADAYDKAAKAYFGQYARTNS